MNELETGPLKPPTFCPHSFNQISEIEGLDTLTKLTDLSLTHNEITELRGLESLTKLQVLSMADNKIGAGGKEVQSVAMYLQPFKHLRLINFQGNPISARDDYKSMIISLLRDLVYLDFRRIHKEERALATEQHSDQVAGLLAAGEEERTALQAAKVQDKHNELMKEANMFGVETLFNDMLHSPDWDKLEKLCDANGENIFSVKMAESREMFNGFVDTFRDEMLFEHRNKEREHKEFREVLDHLIASRDAAARDLVVNYEKLKKRVLRDTRMAPSQVVRKIEEPREKLVTLKRALLELESETSDNVKELNDEFLRNYNALTEKTRSLLSSFFMQIREAEGTLFAAMQEKASEVLDGIASEKGIDPHVLDLSTMNDAARNMVQDKDAFLGAVAAVHEMATTRIDDLEADLAGREVERGKNLSDKYIQWAYKRGRDRIMEISSLVDRTTADLDEFQASFQGQGGGVGGN
jgi:hypothetical protein